MNYHIHNHTHNRHHNRHHKKYNTKNNRLHHRHHNKHKENKLIEITYKSEDAHIKQIRKHTIMMTRMKNFKEKKHEEN